MSLKQKLKLATSALSISAIFLFALVVLFSRTLLQEKKISILNFIFSAYQQDLNEIISGKHSESLLIYKNLESRKYLLKYVDYSDLINKIDKSAYAIMATNIRSKTEKLLESKITEWEASLKELLNASLRKLNKKRIVLLILIYIDIIFLVLFIILLIKIHSRERILYFTKYKDLLRQIDLINSKLKGKMKAPLDGLNPYLKSFLELISLQKEEFLALLNEQEASFKSEKSKITEVLYKERQDKLLKSSKLTKEGTNNKFLLYILNSLTIPVLVLDDLGIITYANSLFLLTYSLNYESIIGKTAEQLFSLTNKDIFNIIALRIKTVMLSKESLKYKGLYFSPLKGANAKVFGVSIIFYDTEV